MRNQVARGEHVGELSVDEPRLRENLEVLARGGRQLPPRIRDEVRREIERVLKGEEQIEGRELPRVAIGKERILRLRTLLPHALDA